MADVTACSISCRIVCCDVPVFSSSVIVLVSGSKKPDTSPPSSALRFLRTSTVVLPTFAANLLANAATCVSVVVAASASSVLFKSPLFAAVVTLSSTGRSNATSVGSFNFLLASNALVTSSLACAVDTSLTEATSE